MPLSSVLGAQSLVRPGVCTSSTRPASPFEGQLIYETDTNRVVAYDGSNWVYAVDTDQPPGLQLVKTQTIGTAVSSVTVTDAFSADFDNYLVLVNGGVASTNNTLRLTLGSTATGYYSVGTYMAYNSATVNGSNQSNATFWQGAGGGSADNIHAQIYIGGPNLAKTTNYQAWSQRSQASGEWSTIGGYLNDSTQYTAFTLTCNTGTVTGGTIRVYGYRNS